MSEFEHLDVPPVIWCGGEDFARLGGDNAAVYVKPSDLNRKREEEKVRHSQ